MEGPRAPAFEAEREQGCVKIGINFFVNIGHVYQSNIALPAG
jgi:hypothetical protein